MKTYVPALAILLSLSCHKESDELPPREVPPCIQNFIEHNGRVDSGERLLAIYRYKYQKHYVYFGYSDCCDMYNLLFDSDCHVLCAPNGGFSGAGDGKCPNFFKEATEKTELWHKTQ